MSIEQNIDRRGFVKLVGAGVLAAGARSLAVGAGNETVPAGKPAAKFKKAIGFEMIGENLSVLDKFKLVKELGFDGLEVQSAGRADREEFLKAREATGVEIHSVMNPDHWKKPLSHPDPKVREECRQSVQRSLEDARYWGASSVLLVPAVVNKEIAYDEAYTRSQSEIRQLAPVAEKLGVVIGIEFVWNNFLLSPLEFARYIDEINSPMVKAYFDCGNVVRYGWPEQWIRILGGRICKIHIKEYSREKAKYEGVWAGFDVELMEGDCDWPSVTKALREVGYGGYITAEVKGGKRARLAQLAGLMDKIIAG
ncbi:MAG: sugar phosphate isomerase/epimerase family protein [Phycisphaerae bacterium]